MLPTYREYNYKQVYLELHQNRTLWKIDVGNDIPEEEFWELFNIEVELAAIRFRDKYRQDLFFLGRSGRHVCVEDTKLNRLNYRWLKREALKLEQEVIACVNLGLRRCNSETD